MAYVAKENIPAVPITSVQQRFIDAYIPKIPPAVSKLFLNPSGKIKGIIAKASKLMNQNIGLLSLLIFSGLRLFLLYTPCVHNIVLLVGHHLSLFQIFSPWLLDLYS